jgi:hypothetical protein
MAVRGGIVTDDIAAFIRARLDEDETTAHNHGQASGSWSPRGDEVCDDLNAGTVAFVPVSVDRQHIARHDPARVLRQADALRDVLTELEQLAERAPHPDTRMWAAGAIGRMALIWGTTEEVEALGG